MNQTNRNMLEGPLFPNITRFTIPIILTSVLQLLFNAADLVVVGQFCGSVSVAAVGATGSITGLLVNFFIGLSVGAGVAVAHGLGGRENQVVHRTVHTALPTAILSGAILTVAGLTYSETFLIMMGTPDTVLPLSTVYMRIIFCGVTFNMVYNFCASILRAAGDTKSPLVFLLFAGVLNVILNLVFVIQFQMNVAGVALATIISQAVSAVLVVIALMRRTDACKLYLNKLRFYKPQLAKILRIGLPAGIQSALFAISNVLIQSSVNSFGDVFMSGNAAASNLEGFVYVCLNAFHQSAVNFVGQNAGARNYRRVRQSIFCCMGTVTVLGIVLGGLVILFGESLLSIFAPGNESVIHIGMIPVRILSSTYFLCGLMDVGSGVLRGLGKSFRAMVISLVGSCVTRIIWIYTVFAADHTLEVLYACYPLSWVLTAATHFTVAFVVLHKLEKQKQADLTVDIDINVTVSGEVSE